jgi:hypothetical protein
MAKGTKRRPQEGHFLAGHDRFTEQSDGNGDHGTRSPTQLLGGGFRKLKNACSIRVTAGLGIAHHDESLLIDGLWGSIAMTADKTGGTVPQAGARRGHGSAAGGQG